MFLVLCLILCGLPAMGIFFWILLHPEKWERLAALQERVRKWKPRTVRKVVIGIAVVAVVDLLLLRVLPDWAALTAALLLLAAQLALFLLYYRCPKCGRVQSFGSLYCCFCGEPLPWDEQNRRNL